MPFTKPEVHNDAGGGPSHGHRQHTQKIGKYRACDSGGILADRQTDRHTDIHTDVFITILRNRSSGRSNNDDDPCHLFCINSEQLYFSCVLVCDFYHSLHGSAGLL